MRLETNPSPTEHSAGDSDPTVLPGDAMVTGCTGETITCMKTEYKLSQSTVSYETWETNQMKSNHEPGKKTLAILKTILSDISVETEWYDAPNLDALKPVPFSRTSPPFQEMHLVHEDDISSEDESDASDISDDLGDLVGRVVASDDDSGDDERSELDSAIAAAFLQFFN